MIVKETSQEDAMKPSKYMYADTAGLIMNRTILSCLCCLFVTGVDSSSAQNFPSKPIRILTGAAGGGADLGSRTIAQGITGSLGQPVVVENRPSVAAIETVAKAAPDGHTLYYGGGTVWISPYLQDVSWDPLRDFSPVVITCSSSSTVVVHPSLPVESVKDLIALARSKPGELNYGAVSVGSATHLNTELFRSMAKINVVPVPYKGSAAALTALASGEVQMMITSTSSVMSHVKSGRLKALAVTSAQPPALLPGIPTVTASGLPGYVVAAIDGVLVPAKTPAAIIARLNQEIVRFLNTPEAQKRFTDAGVDVVASSTQEFSDAIKSDMAVWGKLIKEAKIRLE